MGAVFIGIPPPAMMIAIQLISQRLLCARRLTAEPRVRCTAQSQWEGALHSLIRECRRTVMGRLTAHLSSAQMQRSLSQDEGMQASNNVMLPRPAGFERVIDESDHIGENCRSYVVSSRSDAVWAKLYKKPLPCAVQL